MGLLLTPPPQLLWPCMDPAGDSAAHSSPCTFSLTPPAELCQNNHLIISFDIAILSVRLCVTRSSIRWKRLNILFQFVLQCCDTCKGHVTCKIVSEMTYNVSSGTLNLTIPYHRMPYHWHAAQGPHHSDPAAASLAPGPRTSLLQARLVRFQGVARSVAAICRGWLSAASRYRAPSTPIVWRCDLFCPADSLVSHRLLFRCGWTENMEHCLLIKLRQPDLSLERLRRLLKMHLFS